MTKTRDLADFVSAGNPLADGTIDVADINGVTATTTEINYLDGVTSNIQSQFDGLITDLVSDTTPQLGGNLDTNGNDITFGDNDKAIFGAGSDLQIYHDGSHSYILDNGTGNLRILAQTFQLRNSTNSENMIAATPDGEVTLFYDNSGKLATTATGVTVTGTVAATAFSGDGSALTGIQAGAGYFQGENGATGDTTNGKGDIFRVHEPTLNTSTTIASSDNALAAGPLTVASGVTLTVSGNLSIV